MQDPDWNDFKFILALSRGGSVAGAARALSVDSSTISRRLAALEDCLGARLIVRGGQKFAWTAEGRSILGAAEAIETSVRDATRAVRSSQVDACVTVSAPSGLSAAIGRLLVPIKERRPDLKIELCGENRSVDLAKGEADIAVRMFRPSEPDLVCKQAFELGWAVYGARSYLDKHSTPASFDDLGAHSLVRYVPSLHKVPGPRWLEEHRGNAADAMMCDNTEVAATVVAAGAGIGVLPCPVAELHEQMVRVFPDRVASATGWLVYHESTRERPCVRSVVELLCELFDEHRSLFSGLPD